MNEWRLNEWQLTEEEMQDDWGFPPPPPPPMPPPPPEGGYGIMCPEPCWQCHRPHQFLCDGPSPTGKGECDRLLCVHHRTSAGAGVDYCIEHAQPGPPTTRN